MSSRPFVELEELIGHQFKDQNLLQMALTHSSVGGGNNYERLEFLGDRVLGLVVASALYNKFPQEQEGDLAKRLASLVQGALLAKASHQIHLGEFIHFSDAERAAGGASNDHILADVFESLIGALYMEAGYAPCQTLIEKLLEEDFYTMKEPPQHPKTELQEWAQAKSLPLPLYEISGQEGPDHAPVFEVSLGVEGYDKITAKASSRQEAEKLAAQSFMELLEETGAA